MNSIRDYIGKLIYVKIAAAALTGQPQATTAISWFRDLLGSDGESGHDQRQNEPPRSHVDDRL